MKYSAYRVAKYVGSYVAAMNGVDVIAFTAGIGENSGTVRSAVLKYLGYLGITVDEKANDTHGEEDYNLYTRFKSSCYGYSY